MIMRYAIQLVKLKGNDPKCYKHLQDCYQCQLEASHHLQVKATDERHRFAPCMSTICWHSMQDMLPANCRHITYAIKQYSFNEFEKIPCQLQTHHVCN